MGQNATFTVDAYPNRVFHGVVTAVRQAPINVQNVVTYDVVIGVSNDDLKLFPGMTATVKILVDHRDNALKIPSAALRYRPFSSATAVSTNRKTRGASASQTVWTLGVDGQPQPIEVQLGISDGSWTEVRSGNLQEGEPVIVGAASRGQASATSPASPLGGGPSRRGPGF